ncbi:MAG: flagellar hook-basal body complex protein FliE [Sinobacteraceae bacterium]|nr:flagellar hook-basal body complex protein FliE [Nevskiaceae bacterium]MBV8852635.1 flagellar hook-basal body complex protein FliE [Nevskiaceae bacterium]MBV9914275.1 flagellar hook-basal body complex protein FliE [Nevskiaceae bacterium]
MSQMEIDAVLAQIRSLSAQTRLSAPAADVQAKGPSEFANILSKGIEQVNQTDMRASQLADAFQRGTPGVELPQVMLEMQKATVSFRALTEVRNRLVSAYQEIMNMQL